MYKKISDYGIIGDLHTVALVGLDGSIDWLCLPHIDSPSVFGALLDDEVGGRFAVAPTDEWDSVPAYVSGTNVLVTRFRTRMGVMELTDFMPVSTGDEEDREDGGHNLLRRIRIEQGEMGVRVLFDPRFDYARAPGELTVVDGGVAAGGGGSELFLDASRDLAVTGGRCDTVFELARGDEVWLRLSADPARLPLDTGDATGLLASTKEFWRRWLGRMETGREMDAGARRQMLDRSALVLKLLYYSPTGTIAAAATTSLPEEIGGIRNWDYRFTWVRDASFTLQALYNIGHLSEMEGYLRWIEHLLSEHGPASMQIMYGLRGEEELPEEELGHLDGYKGSRPVRIGNGASTQRQLDIYGELMDAALKLSDYVGKIDAGLWPFLQRVCDYVVDHWGEKDAGIWEVRGGPHHFVYSKVMCWVALDRGITIAERYGFPGGLGTWIRVREEIKAEVLDRGWSREKGAFVQHYDTDALDASTLLIPLMGFLPFTDPRVVSTIEATRRELEHDGFLYRYTAADGIRGGEGTFLLCTFWLVDCLAALGRIREAEEILGRVESVANHLGLFAEEYDVTWREQLGNFPQAFTHIGYINSVTRLARARGDGEARPDRSPSFLDMLLSREIVLNDGPPGRAFPHDRLVEELKEIMNTLRGAFFDGQRGRVAYERMHGSELYARYVELSRALGSLDPGDLQDREARIAFWINLYNVIVIHAVIDLGIRDSVKEVRNFFRRVKYVVGGDHFSPDDIEHGILRGNRRHPGSVFRPFGSDDPRLRWTVEPMDPRIHFALVCASSSCPPIGVYTAENLDQELDVAARSFLTGGGLELDRERGTISLSRIFSWYGGDFGASEPAILRRIATYVHDVRERDFILENADTTTVRYQEYDWRLNRY